MKPANIAPYLLSIPERALRSAAALAGGLLREIGDVTLPSRLRRTLLYQTLVEATLRFLVEQVGQVEDAYPAGSRLAEDFLMRRTAGNGLDLIGILAFRASPVWVMAALADLSGTGRQLILEISESLKQDGLLDSNTRFETVDQILDGLEKTASRVTDTLSTPPLDVAGLRKDWAAIRKEAAAIPGPNLPSAAGIRQRWDALRKEAREQDLTVFELSSLMAISAARRIPRGMRVAGRRTGQLFNAAILDHYSTTLKEIHETGYLTYWGREFRPYLRAAALNFSPRRPSLTQKLLRNTRRYEPRP